VDRQVFQAHQAFQEFQAKMDYRAFQVLKVNELLVKQVMMSMILVIKVNSSLLI
jgi:hypothetical protein